MVRFLSQDGTAVGFLSQSVLERVNDWLGSRGWVPCQESSFQPSGYSIMVRFLGLFLMVGLRECASLIHSCPYINSTKGVN